MDLLELLDKGIIKINEERLTICQRALKGEIAIYGVDGVHFYKLVPVEEDSTE
ncbi:MAG: hypothetical protein IKU98_01430 [Bacteroidaceae bacterium]|nr:hypothetical protein [Bacteroidaceae bacterium]